MFIYDSEGTFKCCLLPLFLAKFSEDEIDFMEC